MEILEDYNPWWYSDDWEKEDKHLRLWESQRYRWFPEWLNELSLEPFSLNFVIGPRQVGKTTGLKLLIGQLIKSEKIQPEDITFLSCDIFTDMKELRDILFEYAEVKKGILILDEITSVEYWWKIVKALIDLGKLENHVVIVSGSSAVKLFKFYEAFSGRMGKGKRLEVLPLSFPEYIKLHKKAYGTKIKVLFERYLSNGGFPRSINEDKSFLEDLIISIDREISRIGKDPKIARKVIYSVIKKAPSAVSYSTLGKEVELNHVTTREYLGLLEDLFILGISFWKDKDVNFKKEKKIFIRDPFIARIFAEIYNLELRRDFLYEWTVQEHLLRKYGEIYYYRNKYEIDILAGDLKIEVKAGKSHRKYPRNVLILDEEDLPRFLMEM